MASIVYDEDDQQPYDIDTFCGFSAGEQRDEINRLAGSSSNRTRSYE